MEFSKQNLLDYLSGPLNVDIGGLDENSLLFSSGLVDSFSMIDLITYLESTFQILRVRATGFQPVCFS